MVTTDSALQQATVWACVRVISEVLAQLPVKIQTKNESGQWVDSEHDALRLVHEPNEWQSKHEFISHLTSWAELQGNGYYFKSRDSRGGVRELIPLQADGVEPKHQKTVFRLRYKVSGDNRIEGEFNADRILHMRNFGTDGWVGLSTIANLRNCIGLALQTEEHGARLFKQGAQPGLAIKAPSATQEQIERLQQKLADKYEGAVNAHKTMVLQGDMSLEKIGMTNEDAQFLETRHFSKQEIASAFGVPLFILNDTKNSTTWGTGLEQQLRAFKTLSLGPRIKRLGSTLDRELLMPDERATTRFAFDLDELDMADFKDRMEGYRSGIEAGVLNPNEARDIEGRNPREGGDKYRKPMNTGIEGEDDEPNTDV